MDHMSTFRTYDRTRTYDFNYEHAPDPVDVEVPPVPGKWDFCGLPVDSPLGIPAGPLLNGRWVLYYASLGFDILTYKTVRSGPRPCYSLPRSHRLGAVRHQGRARRAAGPRGRPARRRSSVRQRRGDDQQYRYKSGRR